MTPHELIIENTRLVYSTAGSPANPALFFIHGWLSHRGVWQTTLAALQAHYYCVALDLLGFGDSDKPANGDYRIAAQAERVIALADALGIERFGVVGHSMGGQIATYLTAITAPQRITCLVSVAGVVTGKLSALVMGFNYPSIQLARWLPFLFFPLNNALRDVPAYARIAYRPWFYRMNNPPFDQWAADRRYAMQPTQRYSAALAGQAIVGTNLTPHLAKITVPTLLLFGKQDGTVPPSEAEFFQQHLPTSLVVFLDECGHFPMYEQPTAYLDAIQSFVQGITAEQPSEIRSNL